jgi:rare lipoprotein A
MFEMRTKMISAGLLGSAVLLPLDLAQADQLGHASWYSLPSNITANGERMDPNELTAAHRSLPFGTQVLVENLSNGRSVVVRINDRGPFIGGRIIDLSKAAAASIGMIGAGTAKVRVTKADGSVLEALGDATAKAKDGAALYAAAKVDASTAGNPPKAKAVVSRPSKSKTLAAKASAGTYSVAKKFNAQARMQTASAQWRTPVRSRFAASSNGMYAAAYRASSLDGQRFALASNQQPYAVLGETPSFMKPSRKRRLG